jgi:hypothetical protein
MIVRVCRTETVKDVTTDLEQALSQILDLGLTIYIGRLYYYLLNLSSNFINPHKMRQRKNKNTE